MALKEELPIGSGEIESAHYYVIQQRLKLTGAWWKEDKAAKMLALKIIRANGQWEAYWQRGKAALKTTLLIAPYSCLFLALLIQ